jgi:hypothetical protein
MQGDAGVPAVKSASTAPKEAKPRFGAQRDEAAAVCELSESSRVPG